MRAVYSVHTVCLGYQHRTSEWMNEANQMKLKWKFRNINECIFQSFERQQMMLHIGNARREYCTTARKKIRGNWKWCVKKAFCDEKYDLIEITCFRRIELSSMARQHRYHHHQYSNTSMTIDWNKNRCSQINFFINDIVLIV